MSEPALDPEQQDDIDDEVQNEAVQKAAILANALLEMPERFGMSDGDEQLCQQSLDAMKGVFDFAIESEADALVALRSYFTPLLDESQLDKTRNAGGGKKRKRKEAAAHYSFLDPTPLDGLTVDNANEDQLWHQLEIKNEKMSSLLGVAMIETGEDQLAALEESEDKDAEATKPADEVAKKRGNKKGVSLHNGHADDAEDDEDQSGHKRVVHSIKDLSDDDLRSLGIDPSRRAEMEMMDEDEDEEEDEDDEYFLEESEEEEENEDSHGYAGASDLSDDDEMHGKIIIEPLRTEEEQRKRQAEILAEEKQKARRQRELKRLMGIPSEDDSDEGDDEDAEGEEKNIEDDNKEEEMPSAHNGSLAARIDSREIVEANITDHIASLDARDRQNGLRPSKWKSHPVLDDDFFSIDQFNKDTDDYGDEGVDLGEEVNLFRPIDIDEEEPVLYKDFFAPPPGASDLSSRDVVAKGAAAEAGAVNGKVLQQKPSVRFHEEVAVRQIKSRKSGEMEITPELLEAIRKEKEGETEEDEGSSEEEYETDDEQGSEEEVESDISADDDEEEMEGSASEDDEDVKMELSNGLESEEENDEFSEEEAETAHRVAGDLFAEEESEASASNGIVQSNHEKRLEKLQKEIAKLEKENVTKKDWTLMGETGSRTRPENSLLAESLDFENNQRRKPIITPETTLSLEDMIKKRILESHFDDVERRANIQAFDFIPSKMLELSDTKSGKSLDQVYEDEMGMGNGETHGEKMNKQLAADHEEIRKLYDELEHKLDSLSNAHFTPKAPKATIQTISNTPTITLEESLPTTTSYATQLTPEEIYDVGRHNTTLQGERSEMTPEEKKRLQRQLRADKKARNERIESVKKNVEINKEAFAQNRGGRFVGSSKRRSGSRNDAKEKEEALSKLMGNRGVTVVGKDGKSQQGSHDTKKRRIDNDTSSLNANHLKL